ncbi:long-chain-fatty-acid--CoA ligase [Paraglaciecola arctica]|uniref:long-chain-fatty-acid--CoA ligase n=1 Tax=Paraglaciecola arctica TaxID=1128911 RepID=UPI001C077300|nr:long-chain-fatty-acid--CoA ligase [Paraglaciecola arctica]MBU3002487.1 long-chain-fatty-acid--CoA ligase [Paraglaciecola arctica]
MFDSNVDIPSNTNGSLDSAPINPDTICQLLSELAQRKSNSPAMYFENKVWTYKELETQSKQTAHTLLSKNVQPGDKIAWLAQNVADFWIALFAASQIGAVITPINWRLSPIEISQILVDANASILIGEAQFIDSLCLKKNLNIETIYLDPQRENSLQQLCSIQPFTDIEFKPHLDDPVVQLYTSGTTGLPKGVVLTNKCFKEVAASQFTIGILQPKFNNEIILHTLPHFHIAGLTLGLIGWKLGLPLMQYRQFEPERILKLAQERIPLNGFFVPSMIMMLLNLAKKKNISLESFASVSYGAAPMPSALLEEALQAMPNASFYQFYGLTETTGGISVLMSDDHHRVGSQRLSAGLPLPHCEVKIVNPYTNEQLSTGQAGEIITKSNFLMQGYWNNAKATKDAIKDGWFKTGDIGKFDDNGYLYVIDRIKDMIISGGENIYPAEIENILGQHPGVMEVAVVGMPDDKWGEAVRVVLVTRAGVQLTEGDVIQHLTGRISRFKMPKKIDFIDALPRNPAGKILKRAIREQI